MSVQTTEKKPRKAAVKRTAVGAKKAKSGKTAATAEVALNMAKVKQWPSHTEIAVLAHRYYVERGWKHGFHEQDWLRAEQELLAAS